MNITDTDIANKALAKIGGSGDTESGSGFISDINAADKVAGWCKKLLPFCRQEVIIDLAVAKSPFKETNKFADLGNQIDSADLPEIGSWEYAFNLPANCLAVVNQFDETLTYDSQGNRQEYQFDIILNNDNNGKIFLTNNLTNTNGDSAYISYVIDQTITRLYSMALIECIATKLAAEISPLCGKNIPVRQQVLLEYIQKSRPEAKIFNQSQFDIVTEDIENYLGGRNE